MSSAVRPAADAAQPLIDRLHPWIAVLVTALLHLAVVLLALFAPPVTMSSPEGAAGGGRIEVTFIDRNEDAIPSPPEFPRVTPTREAVPPRPDPVVPPAATRLQTTQVDQTEDPIPPDADAPRDATPAPAASARSTPRQSQHVWGQPPGMLREHHAPVNAGTAPSAAVDNGRRHRPSPGETNLEAGGFQVIYDLLGETRLREWRDAGMTEIFIPLPGERRFMVCPLETALRRGSGPCRLVHPEDPEMADIGDAREVITMHQVYRRGEMVWRGPGPYR
ncbi:hypothetical protein ACW5F0_14250 [Luteimonas sp. A534]